MILSNDVSTVQAAADGCSFWSCLVACVGPCAVACAVGDTPLIPIVDVGASVGSGFVGDVVADVTSEPSEPYQMVQM